MFIRIFNITQYWHLQKKKATKKIKQIQFQCDVQSSSTCVLAHVNNAHVLSDDDDSPTTRVQLTWGYGGVVSDPLEWDLDPRKGQN